MNWELGPEIVGVEIGALRVGENSQERVPGPGWRRDAQKGGCGGAATEQEESQESRRPRPRAERISNGWQHPRKGRWFHTTNPPSPAKSALPLRKHTESRI